MKTFQSALLLLTALMSTSSKISGPEIKHLLCSFIIKNNSEDSLWRPHLPSTLLTPLTPLTPPGAQEIVYAQVGQTVTLNPPANFKSLNYYLKWTFGKAEIAWSNYLNGKGVTVCEWHIEEQINEIVEGSVKAVCLCS